MRQRKASRHYRPAGRPYGIERGEGRGGAVRLGGSDRGIRPQSGPVAIRSGVLPGPVTTPARNAPLPTDCDPSHVLLRADLLGRASLQIIGVNIVLSGDNAVVIALAARSLPPEQQRKAIAIGSAAAVVMRIVLTIIAVEMLRWPYLKLIGAALLLWIAVQLLLPDDEEHGGGKATGTMSAAIRTILIADLVMSLDNVLAVAAAAKGSIVLLVVGLRVRSRWWCSAARCC